MVDVYRNLSIKMAGLLNWMNKFCTNFKGFLLKVDDDVYVSLRTLEYFIHDNDPSSPGMYGYIFGDLRFVPFPVRGKNLFSRFYEYKIR